MTWDKFLKEEMKKGYFKDLSKFLAADAKSHKIFPTKKDIFNAFDCELENVKVVILGADPYHGTNQAHGLSFSVQKGIAIPPSLRNIFKELKSDLDIDPPSHGCLSDWSSRGVLLLNSVLTVRESQAGSHRGKGWETFTDGVLSLLNSSERPLAFILWGAYAKEKIKLLNNKKHFILMGHHPSPLSANNGGFFGGKYFSKANNFLTKNGIEPINWKL